MISIVCVYNDKNILDNYLLKSLKDQTEEFELIAVDNTHCTFKSAAKALNYGGNTAKGKYILFTHQDVDFRSNVWLKNAEKILDSISGLGIAGVAGMSVDGQTSEDKARNIIKHGNEEIWGKKIEKPEPVQTLDECLVIIPKSIFDELKFDDKTCDDWHLYTVDYCLSAKKLGLGVYAIPMFIYHKSTGDSNCKGYTNTLKKVLKKHKSHVKRVYTTFDVWFTSYPISLQKFTFLAIRLTYLLLINLGLRYLWRKSGLKQLMKAN